MGSSTEKPFILPIEGMESEHCSMIIDKGLRRLPEITTLKVELNNRRALIETPDVLTAIPDAVRTIRELGYGVTTVRKTFPVLQMTCASCAVSVESIVQTQPGVVAASVNFAGATLQVEYLPTITNPEALRAAVQNIGYDLVVTEADTQTTLEELQEKSYQALRRRTIGAVALSLPVVVIGMFFMDMPYANYIMWALSTPVIVWFGKDFFIHAWKQARHRRANMDTLVALSTGVSYIFSVFNTLFPHFWHERGMHAHVYFEAAAVVIAFILLGKMLEERAKGNTASAIRKLIGLQSKTVHIVHAGGHVMEMPIERVQKEDVLLVKPGDKIPLDGMVISGDSYVDESMLTGEPVPVHKSTDEKVFAGTLNGNGSFHFRVTQTGSETMLAQIIRMVQDAQGSKAPVQKQVDRIAGIFVPIVIGIAVMSAAAWWIFGGEDGITQGLLALVTVLVIACPCALGLATPTAIMVGVGKGAAQGILIKDAESLERAKEINAIVLDKTGTITEGHPRLTDIEWFNEDGTIQRVFYTLEKNSAHPLAAAITQAIPGIQPVDITAYENISGRGVKGVFQGKTWYAGNAALLSEHAIRIPVSLSSKAEAWAEQAKTLIWFADDTQAYAVAAVTDTIKPTSAAAIKQLQDMRIEVYMLTGDNHRSAQAIAQQVGIQHVEAGLLPKDKADFIKRLQSNGNVVAMVGDGINDTTALAQADVSIAMGKGSDIALDVAKITLITSDLMKVPTAIYLSRKTVAAIRQNLFWAFIYNLIGIPIAAGVLYPFTGFMLNPMIAGAAMALSSVSVVSNSLRLKWTSTHA